MEFCREVGLSLYKSGTHYFIELTMLSLEDLDLSNISTERSQSPFEWRKIEVGFSTAKLVVDLPLDLFVADITLPPRS